MNKLTITVAAVCTLLVIFATAHAQDEFSLHFDAAHIVGNDQSIFVHRVPVTNQETGEIVLKDVIVEFAVAEDGSIIVDTVFSDTSIPVPNSASNFIPGTYEDSEGNRYIVSAGGATADGRTSGSIRSDTEGVTFNATWVTGSVIGHPLIGSLPIAPDLVDGPVYGLVGDESFNQFHEGGLIAAAQVGTSLTITAYHQCCPTNTSFGQGNFTLLPIAEGAPPPPSVE